MQIFTDGSFKNGTGSWSFVVVQKNFIVHEDYGLLKDANCNRAEFTAVIKALDWIRLHLLRKERKERKARTSAHAILFSDSRVVIDAVTLKMHDWNALGWLKKNGRPIPDVDLVQNIFELTQELDIGWTWIRAHSGNIYNDRCDHLCFTTRERLPFERMKLA